MSIDWKHKLTSRKFWAAVVGFVAAVLAYCGAEESVVTQVTACIMAGATLIAYILGEGLVDARYKAGKIVPETADDGGEKYD